MCASVWPALAARLGPERAGQWQTFLTNSGTEAVEAALKLARHHTKRSAIDGLSRAASTAARSARCR